MGSMKGFWGSSGFVLFLVALRDSRGVVGRFLFIMTRLEGFGSQALGRMWL